MAGTTIPNVPPQFFDNNGDPADSYQLFTYEAGTTTKLATYSDSDLTTANTNPIVLDAAGRATIFLIQNTAYKFVLADDTDTDPPAAPIWTRDNVMSLPDSPNVDIRGVAGRNLTAGQVVYLDGSGEWDLADRDSVATAATAVCIGFATEAITAAETGTFRIAGQMTGLSGLTAGTTYHIGSTAGTLTNAAGDVHERRIVGRADSTTTLIMAPQPPFEDNMLRGLLAVGYDSGYSNASTSLEAATGYSVSIPGDLVSEAGQALLVEGTVSVDEDADSKKLYIKLGGGTTTEIFETTKNVASEIVPFRILIRYRTSTTAAITGVSFIGAASGGEATPLLVNTTLGAVDWTSDQTLALYIDGTSAGDLTVTDFNVSLIHAPGTLV